MRKPKTTLRKWMASTCASCGVPYKIHEGQDHKPVPMTYGELAAQTGISRSTLEKLGALDREPRTGTATLLKLRYPEAPL